MPDNPILQRAAELLALSDDELPLKGAAAGLVERPLSARRRRTADPGRQRDPMRTP